MLVLEPDQAAVRGARRVPALLELVDVRDGPQRRLVLAVRLQQLGQDVARVLDVAHRETHLRDAQAILAPQVGVAATRGLHRELAEVLGERPSQVEKTELDGLLEVCMRGLALAEARAKNGASTEELRPRVSCLEHLDGARELVDGHLELARRGEHVDELAEELGVTRIELACLAQDLRALLGIGELLAIELRGLAEARGLRVRVVTAARVGDVEVGELVVFELLAIHGLQALAEVAALRRSLEADLERAQRRLGVAHSAPYLGEDERELLGGLALLHHEPALHDVGPLFGLLGLLVERLERREDLLGARIPVERRVVDGLRLRAILRLEELPEATGERAHGVGVLAVLRGIELLAEELDEVLFAPAALEDGAEQDGAVDLRRILVDDLAQLDGSVLVGEPELLHAHLHALETKLRALGAILDVADDLQDERHQLVELVGASIDVEEQLPRVAIDRIALVQLLVDGACEPEIAERTGRQAGDLVEEAPRVVGLGELRGLALEQHGFADVAGLLADPRELGEGPHAALLVLLTALEVTAEQRLREVALLELLGDLHGLAHRLRRAVGERPALHQRVDERALATGRAREALVEIYHALAGGMRGGRALEELLGAVSVGIASKSLLERIARSLDVVRLEAELREPIQRVARSAALLGVERDAHAEHACLTGVVAEALVDAIERRVELAVTIAHRDGALVQRRRFAIVAALRLGDLGEPHEERAGELGVLRRTRTTTAARAAFLRRHGERAHALFVRSHLAEGGREALRCLVDHVGAGVDVEGAQAHLEGILDATEMLLVEPPQLSVDARCVRGRPAARDASLEGTYQVAVIVGAAQRCLETSRLDDALGRELERRLEDLLRAIGLALATGDLAQLEHDLGARDGRVLGDLLLATKHREQGAIGALRAIELAIVPRELGERAQDLRIRRVDARRSVELDERTRAIADREIETREVIVDGRALLGTATTEGLDERAEVRARLLEATGSTERVSERELHGVVVGREIGRLLEQRDRALGLAGAAAMQLRRLAKATEARRLVGRVRGALGEQLCERPPRLRRAIHLGQAHADVIGLGIACHLVLEPLLRVGRLAGCDERIGKAQRHGGARGTLGHLAQAIEIARGALVIACGGRQPCERIERGRARLEIHEAPEVLDGARHVAELRLRDLGGASMEIGGKLGFAVLLCELRLPREERLELAVLAVAREEHREHLHRRVVTRRLAEVLVERCDRARLRGGVAELVLERRHLEAEREPGVLGGRRADEAALQIEELGLPTGSHVELHEAVDRVRVLRILVDELEVDARRAIGLRIRRTGQELLDRDACRLVAERSRLLARPRQRRRLDEQRDDLVVVAVALVDLHELGGRAVDVGLGGGGRSRRHAVVDREDLGGVGGEAVRPALDGEPQQAIEDRLGQRAIADAGDRRVCRLGEEIEIAAGSLREAEQAVDERAPLGAALQLGELGQHAGVGGVVRERAGVRSLRGIGIAATIAMPHGDGGLDVAREVRRKLAAALHERCERERRGVPAARCARGVLDGLHERRLERLACPGALHDDARRCVPAHRSSGDADHRARGIEVGRRFMCNMHVSLERAT